MNRGYYGHTSQLYGVEEHRLVGGRGDGMRLFQVHNADGLAFTVSADRCGDISRISYKGVNLSYFAPCGYVAPAYYDGGPQGFLKSFTAGFFTTCGLTNVGPDCYDGEEFLPQHGTIGNLPCEYIWWTETEDAIQVHCRVNDSRMFGRKLVLHRTLSCGKWESWLKITDRIENQSDAASPAMLLYHMNFGYPLLTEDVQIDISSVDIQACTPYAQEGIGQWRTMPPPQVQAEEQCYNHTFGDTGRASVYNPRLKMGVELSFDPKVFGHMTQWKMPGYRDYALGLEPGNCTTDGRPADREKGILQYVEPGQEKTHELMIRFFER